MCNAHQVNQHIHQLKYLVFKILSYLKYTINRHSFSTVLQNIKSYLQKKKKAKHLLMNSLLTETVRSLTLCKSLLADCFYGKITEIIKRKEKLSMVVQAMYYQSPSHSGD